MKTKLLLISLLCIGLLSCEKDNKRENDKNSSNNQENVNGEEGENGSSDENVKYPQGAIKGVFSVSGTKKVAFSQGNLQYQASTDTWRFAEHQYDFIGYANISSIYTGWIDLFGWGTGYNPTNASEDNEDYLTFVDWGVNKISNGGNVLNAWFTLSIGEWVYLLEYRPNASAKQGVACVNGINGLVLLPDNWKLPSGVHFTSAFAGKDGYEYYKTVNTYTASEWILMGEAGAVFLPAAGERYGTSMNNVGTDGYYWTSEYDDSDRVCFVSFGSVDLGLGIYYDRLNRISVRLCSEISSK